MKVLVLLWSFTFIAYLNSNGQNIANIDSLERRFHSVEGVEKATAAYELVYSYLRVDIQKARLYHNEVEKMLSEKQSQPSLSYLYMAEGIFLSRTGKLDSAIQSLEKAKQVAEASNSHHALVRIYAALGHAFISSGKPEKGLEQMFAGMKVLQRNPDKEMEMKLRTNVAWAYLELKQYRNCIAYGLQNLKEMEGTQYEWIALYTYNNVAISYGAIGKIDSAKYFIGQGINAAKKANDVQSLANGHFILGTIYANAKQYEDAIGEYLKARPYRERVGNPLFLVSDLYTVSDLYYKTREYKSGIVAGEEALALAKKYDLNMKFEGTYESLAKNYEGLGDFKNASKYFKLWAAAKDSVYKNSSANAIAEMRTKFETEKKEQQLLIQNSELLRKEAELQITYLTIAALLVIFIFASIILFLVRSRIQKRRLALMKDAQIRATIQSQENERRRFAQDLHDGMGQLISALRLTIHSLDHNKDNSMSTHLSKAEALLNEMHHEIRGIAFNLMPQTLLKNGVVAALNEVISRLSSSSIKINVSSFELPERLDQLKEIALYRILQEWLNNIIKYSNAKNIEIQFVGHQTELTIIIEDDGDGFDVQALNHGEGHGWKNIQSRVSFLHASIDVDSQLGRRGTTLTLSIPVAAAVADDEKLLVLPAR